MIAVEITQSYAGIELDVNKLKELVRSVCGDFAVTDAEVSITIIDDAETIKLNKKFLGKGKTTDCISFDLSEETGQKIFDISINGQIAVKQAEDRGHSPQAEAALYIIHGLLHNLGFDDAADEQAEKMHLKEDEILTHAGYGSVYKNK